MVFIVLGCIVGGIVGQLGCSPCYGAVGTPPPHNLAHGHPLRMAVPFVCVCVLCGGGVPTLCEGCASTFRRRNRSGPGRVWGPEVDFGVPRWIFVVLGCFFLKVKLYSVLLDCVGVCEQLFLEKVF